jgi:hypothetical protein
MNTLEIDTIEKTSFNGGLCQKQITPTIKRIFGSCGKYGSRPSNGKTLGRYTYRRQFNERVLRSYWKTTLFKGLREFHEALSYLDIQHRSSTRRRIYRERISLHLFYLIHRCAGHTMTDVTRLLENPVKATTIVKKIYLLLVKHVLCKKKEKKI